MIKELIPKIGIRFRFYNNLKNLIEKKTILENRYNDCEKVNNLY